MAARQLKPTTARGRSHHDPCDVTEQGVHARAPRARLWHVVRHQDAPALSVELRPDGREAPRPGYVGRGSFARGFGARGVEALPPSAFQHDEEGAVA